MALLGPGDTGWMELLVHPKKEQRRLVGMTFLLSVRD